MPSISRVVVRLVTINKIRICNYPKNHTWTQTQSKRPKHPKNSLLALLTFRLIRSLSIIRVSGTTYQWSFQHSCFILKSQLSKLTTHASTSCPVNQHLYFEGLWRHNCHILVQKLILCEMRTSMKSKLSETESAHLNPIWTISLKQSRIGKIRLQNLTEANVNRSSKSTW